MSITLSSDATGNWVTNNKCDDKSNEIAVELEYKVDGTLYKEIDEKESVIEVEGKISESDDELYRIKRSAEELINLKITFKIVDLNLDEMSIDEQTNLIKILKNILSESYNTNDIKVTLKKGSVIVEAILENLTLKNMSNITLEQLAKLLSVVTGFKIEDLDILKIMQEDEEE